MAITFKIALNFVSAGSLAKDNVSTNLVPRSQPCSSFPKSPGNEVVFPRFPETICATCLMQYIVHNK